MSDDQQNNEDDITPDVTDPDLDAFTAVMEGNDREEVVRVSPNRQHVDEVAELVSRAIEGYVATRDDITYVEVLIALTSNFCGVGRRMLEEVEFDMFAITRHSILEILGCAVGRVNTWPPTVQQLGEAEVEGEIVH